MDPAQLFSGVQDAWTQFYRDAERAFGLAVEDFKKVSKDIDAWQQSAARQVSKDIENTARGVSYIAGEAFKDIGYCAENIAFAGSLALEAAVRSVALTANPPLFCLGLLVSAIHPEWMQNSIGRIEAVWDSLDYLQTSVVTLTAIAALPLTVGAFSFFMGGSVGLVIQNKEPVRNN